jgi:hypothetical protein
MDAPYRLLHCGTNVDFVSCPHVTSMFGVVVSPRRIAPWLARFWIYVVFEGSLLPNSEKVKLHASEDECKQVSTAAHVKHRFIHFFAFGGIARISVETSGSRATHSLAPNRSSAS